MLHPDLTTTGKSNHADHQGQQTGKRTPDFHAYPTNLHNPTSNQSSPVTSERCLRREQRDFLKSHFKRAIPTLRDAPRMATYAYAKIYS